MIPYHEYKKERFLESYKKSNEALNDLKRSLHKYRIDSDKIIRRAIFAFFQDFCEYIIDMCESYIVINQGKIDSTSSSLKLIEKAYELNFFDETLKNYLLNCVKLRNRYTHDYYKRELSEKQIEEFCYSSIIYLDIFLENSKDNVVLKYKKTS